MKPTSRRPVGPRFAPLAPAPRGERAHDMVPFDSSAKALSRFGLKAEARACPASCSVLVRTAALLAVAAGVIVALPPLSKGESPALRTSLVGIVSPSGGISREPHATTARRQPLPQPAIREGRLAALSGPSYTGSISKVQAVPQPVTVDAIDIGPLAFAAPSPAQTRPLPEPFAHMAAPAAPTAAAAAAIPLPRPTDLAALTADQAAAAAPKSGATASSLVNQARRLIARGQLAEGRATLKQAVAVGSSHAATILAKTYDPAVLKSWHVKGAKVDPAEARQWYEKAKALGSPAAKDALARLQ